MAESPVICYSGSAMKKILSILFLSAATFGAALAQTPLPVPEIPDAEPPAIAAAAPPAAAPAAAPASYVPQQGAAPQQAAAASVTAIYGMSLREAWGYGGWVMWVLLGISVLAVMLVLYILFSFRLGTVAPRRLISAVRDAIMEGDDNTARRLCEARHGAFASIALTALDCIRATNGEPDSELLRDLVHSEGSRLAESMQSQAQLLLDLAAIAPMLGLLGTTLGMLQAFGSIAQDVLVAAKPVILAQGVSKAIITTIAGLLVAIPCMFMYAIFRRRVASLAGHLEAAAAEIVTAVAARKGAKK